MINNIPPQVQAMVHGAQVPAQPNGVQNQMSNTQSALANRMTGGPQPNQGNFAQYAANQQTQNGQYAQAAHNMMNQLTGSRQVPQNGYAQATNALNEYIQSLRARQAQQQPGGMPYMANPGGAQFNQPPMQQPNGLAAQMQNNNSPQQQYALQQQMNAMGQSQQQIDPVTGQPMPSQGGAPQGTFQQQPTMYPNQNVPPQVQALANNGGLSQGLPQRTLMN